ncbi:haloacetate dehalogenase [Tistlia consotensis]|uniref:Haloacetate dehalogenase n=1 Tax=Tistlia consotensis USBA 355 TaxID=560819 RepID=A0A1Y6CH21_9PROT|nr:alpha/beta hydrolase [Tistlia consotensis]SMF64774.1 haloacetate dehalogenase [Tistlia consotensis USBA 355]SNR96617.1 haloacetate dehalogenase [Tistlia consotensis]
MFDGFETRRIATSGAEIHLRIGGDGPPLILLHGYPQTHLIWHRIAPALAERFTVVCPDLRGCGDSSKPPGGGDHSAYSKRALARDVVEVMETLGFVRFAAAGHDRGGRVLHRLALDHPQRLIRAAVLDIAPTRAMYQATDQAFATAYFHWFFLIQPYDLPERMIGADPDGWLQTCLDRWGRTPGAFDPEAVAEYKRCFREPAAIHATCEDYRAAATIDLEHDAADENRLVECPLLALWGGQGLVGRTYDVPALWRVAAERVEGGPLPGGHFLPEEAPEETLAALSGFFGSGAS